jgi:2-polyprenyl-6-methoxyphenol hydroxylase-like FAD-dependent oxidoreductase
MPSWTKGKVALVGDAAYCALPSAAMDGAAALADALQKHNGDYELAFQDYNATLRPLIEGLQADAVNFALHMIPRTEEDVRKQYSGTGDF